MSVCLKTTKLFKGSFNLLKKTTSSLNTTTASIPISLNNNINSNMVKKKLSHHNSGGNKNTNTYRPPVIMSQAAEALFGNRFYSTNPAHKNTPFLGPPGKLSEIIKPEKFESVDAETIKNLWLQYHSVKDCICAVIPADVYTKLINRSKSCPMFIFPLPGDNGYISILYQNQGDHFVYTYLEQYKKHTVNAVPWMIASHYTDFMESKGIVLMRAEPNLEVLSTVQAQYLYQQTQMYLMEDKKYNLMQTFTYHPAKFDFGQVVENMAKMSLLDKNQTQQLINNVIDFKQEENVKEAEIDTTKKEINQSIENNNSNTTTTTSTTTTKSDNVESQSKVEPVNINTYKVDAKYSAPLTNKSSSLD
ncbi:hypothetical protein CYY_004645 [Polysphondylium violaceum]|uniref:ATP synthase mitochondrial F1 complex assembly factor 1 n=1 Tax=Polysphondylium violaceum TaxID=133409 RepID=A0A8J4PV24_9MYCE|nr:hypothetical protein CYY_004645 [Polysphondylium violaceum]